MVLIFLFEESNEINSHDLLLREFLWVGIDPVHKWICFRYCFIYAHAEFWGWDGAKSWGSSSKMSHPWNNNLFIKGNAGSFLNFQLFLPCKLDKGDNRNIILLFFCLSQYSIDDSQHLIRLKRVELPIVYNLKPLDIFILLNKVDKPIRIGFKFNQTFSKPLNFINIDILLKPNQHLYERITGKHLTWVVEHKFMQHLEVEILN